MVHLKIGKINGFLTCLGFQKCMQDNLCIRRCLGEHRHLLINYQLHSPLRFRGAELHTFFPTGLPSDEELREHPYFPHIGIAMAQSSKLGVLHGWMREVMAERSEYARLRQMKADGAVETVCPVCKAYVCFATPAVLHATYIWARRVFPRCTIIWVS